MSKIVVETISNLEGLFKVTQSIFKDARGDFSRLFCGVELNRYFDASFAQVNLSRTSQIGTVRGIHSQSPPKAEMKYVCCVKGKIYDVAVDLRMNSKSFGEYFGLELSGDIHEGLILPKGFGHAFQALTNDVEMIYFHSEVYQPELDCGVNVLDPEIGIDWPLDISNISTRDKNLPKLRNFNGIIL